MNVRLECQLPFPAAVYWDNTMLVNNYSLKVYMITNCEDPASQNIAYERMKYFIYSELNSTIFINAALEDQCNKFLNAGLKITTLPSEPVDQILGIMLYSKLNAILENRFIVLEVELSSNLGENMTYLHAADETLGPFAEPGWWQDPSLIHSDIMLPNSDKVLSMNSATTWRDLELMWPDETSSDPEDNTVVFASFGNNDTK